MSASSCAIGSLAITLPVWWYESHKCESLAFQAGGGPAADYAKNIAANRDMLVNSVSAIERAAPGLERVVLVTGTKYYGSHLGPFRTPAREDDPRHDGPNY